MVGRVPTYRGRDSGLTPRADLFLGLFTRRMLTMRGHRVRIAIKPQDALRTWAKHSASLDLVICDVAMAETRGPELVARLAKVGGPPRVLFITGYSEEAVHSALRHPVLAKPFTAQALWSAVSAAMG